MCVCVYIYAFSLPNKPKQVQFAKDKIQGRKGGEKGGGEIVREVIGHKKNFRSIPEYFPMSGIWFLHGNRIKEQ